MGNILSQIKINDIFRPTSLVILGFTLYGARVLRRVMVVRAAIAGIGNLPGGRTMYGPYTLLSKILPPIPYINRPGGWQYRQKYGRE